MARWMVNDLGAKSLILISRSGIDGAGAAEAVKQLNRPDVAITVRKCDVADKDELLALHQDFANTLPPIRGVVQCAMVLRVCPGFFLVLKPQKRKRFTNIFQLGCDLPQHDPE